MANGTFVPSGRRQQKVAVIQQIFKLTDETAALNVAIDIAHAIAKAKKANPDVRAVLWDGKEMKELQL